MCAYSIWLESVYYFSFCTIYSAVGLCNTSFRYSFYYRVEEVQKVVYLLLSISSSDSINRDVSYTGALGTGLLPHTGRAQGSIALDFAQAHGYAVFG